MNIEEKNIRKCTGCHACEQSCPTNAIRFNKVMNGFCYPTINYNYCVDCGICGNVCMIEQNRKIDNNISEYYCCINKKKEVLLKSTSGGVFYEIARKTIRNHGIVYATQFDNNKACFIRIHDEDDIYKVMGVKYVESDLGNTFSLIKDDLKSSKKVLFIGTPCQCYGLRKFLQGFNTEKLVIVDLICHGVPSAVIWNEFINVIEKKHKSKLKDIIFRDKKNGWSNAKPCFTFDNGKTKSKGRDIESFYYLFGNNFILREACFTCQFANMQRVGDITIGDCWGVGSHIEISDLESRGASLVIVNTAKGREVFESINVEFESMEMSRDQILQPSLVSPTKKNDNYDSFWKLYHEKGIKKAMIKFSIWSLRNYFLNQVLDSLYKFYKKKIERK